MKVSTVREFRDKATGLMRSKGPVLVTRRGRLAGVFLPLKGSELPAELRKEIFDTMTAKIARTLKDRGISEDEILEDFERWRKERRAARSRR